MSWLRGLAVLLLALLLAVAPLAGWLLGSESGLRFAAAQLRAQGLLEAETVRGRLLDSIELEQVRLSAGGYVLRAERLALRWRPAALLERRLHVEAMEGAGLRIELPPAPAESPPEAPVEPYAGFVLPLDVTLERLHVEDAALVDAQGGAQTVLRRLEAAARLAGGRVHVERLDVDSPWAEVHAGGELGLVPEDPLDLRLRWRVPLAGLSQALQGELIGEGGLSGTLHQLELDQRLLVPAKVSLRASLEPLAEGLPWTARLESDGLDFGAFLPMAEAQGERPGEGLGVWAMRLEAEGDLAGADLRVLELRQEDTRLHAEGRIDWAQALAWQLGLRAEALRPEIIHADWPGRLDAVARSQGMLREGLPHATVELERLDGSLRGYPLQARLQGAVAGLALDIEHFSLRSGRSEIKAVGRVGERLDLRARLASPDLAELLPGAGGALRGTLALAGARSTPSLRADLEGQGVRWQDWLVEALSLKAEGGLAEGQALRAELVARTLRSANQPLLASARIEVAGRVEAHDLRIEMAQAGTKNQPGLGLQLSGAGRWDGARETLRIDEARLNDTPLGDWRTAEAVELVAGMDEARLPDWCWLGDGARLCLRGQWQAGKSTSAAFDLAGLDLVRLKPWLPNHHFRLEGVLDASASLEAPPGAPMTAQTRVEARQATLYAATSRRDEWRALPLEQAYAEASLGAGASRIAADLGLNAANRLSLVLSLPGHQLEQVLPPGQALDGRMDVAFNDTTLLDAFLPMLKDLKGTLAGRIDVAGTLAQPRLSGGAQLMNASALLPEFGTRVEDVDVRVQAGPDHILTLSGEGRMGEGRMTLGGTVSLAQLPAWRADLTLRGENLTAMRLPEAIVQASPDLRLALSPEETRLEGRVEIPEALFNVGERGGPAGARLSEDVRIIGAPPAEQGTPMHTRIEVVLGDKVRVRGMGFNGRISGRLTVIDRPGLPGAVGQGELSIPEGRYKAYGQDLLIQRGRILYADTPLDDPALDIRAVRRVTQDSVVAGVQITGRASRPKATLFSEPAMEQAEVLSYLVTGKSLKRSSGGDAQLMMQAIQAAGYAGGDLLAGQIGGAFGLEEATVETDAGTQEISLVLGRYLTPRLYLRYVQGLEEGLQAFILRYELTRRINVQVQSGVKAGVDVFYSFER